MPYHYTGLAKKPYELYLPVSVPEEVSDLPRPVYFRTYPLKKKIYIVRHQHAFIEFLYAREGSMRVEIDGKTLIVPVFHGIWIPANTPHRIWAMSDVLLECLYLEPDFININNSYCNVVIISHFVREFIHYATENTPVLYDEDQHDGMLVTVLVNLLLQLPDAGFSLSWPRSPTFMHVCREIQANPGMAHSIEEWAEKTSMSIRTFSRRFKKETGISFSEWKKKMRLLESVIILKNNRSVTQVALDLGYSGIASFTFAFRQMFGVPPTRY
ncbi:helix-turn-helix domain-containing protein [Brenneria uluponensis]|uniref:helix-turn-helix domain-containing protein n=1 Tax=Brenneria uluponensis TaxID=3057057 RepID=UPI0028E9C506|nr:AraC family transcriptional regulator [Brenneria ulupoensis]